MPSDYKAITEHNEDQLGKDTSSRKTQVSMYSDSTHFVYEILQNADDHEATEVFFKLSNNEIMIEHNGEQFNEKHVKAITYFGKGTSREDLLKTGRFGIGFKSVFAFTATPIIISWPEHFQIYGLYRVRDYPYPEDFSNCRTRIVLPFNHESEHPDFVEELMTQKEAYRQISECLTKLNMNTLLFTRNIRGISWKIGDRYMCFWREDEVDGNARLTIIRNGVQEKRYLVFSRVPTWKNEKHKAVEIAFAIDGQHQITSIEDDNLFVLFPTTEKTGLRFLLNGPYRTNPARETISKTDDFNVHLMEVTCELMKELLPKIRERKLLNLQFLSVLPNKEDKLIYSPLHNAIVKVFRNQKLTPTKYKDSYAPAKNLYRGTIEMSEVIQDDDLATLLGKDHHSPQWVANPPLIRRRDDKGRFIEDENAKKQNERINDFLDTLDILEWGVEDLIEALNSGAEPIMKWLQNKGDEWYQKFYAFLDDAPSYYEDELSELCIVLCIDGEYRIGSECHFFSDDVKPDENLFTGSTLVDDAHETESQKEEIQEEDFHYVDPAVYSFGSNKNQQEKARKFLETIGVGEVNETERVKAILKQRYREPFNPRDEDMKKFIELVEEDPTSKSIFDNYSIFEIDLKQDNKRWFQKPNKIFVDSPYLDTGLTVYYDAIGEESDSFKRALSPNYAKRELGISLQEFGKFAGSLGAQTILQVDHQPIPSKHPEQKYLFGTQRIKNKNFIDDDYYIPEFLILVSEPSIDKSKLIWNTMCSLPIKHLQARFRWNGADELRQGHSTLIHELKNIRWVPQKDDTTYFTLPEDASRNKLPEGFSWPKGYPDDAGDEWIKAIEFGKKTKEQQEEHAQRNQQAKDFGFASIEEAEKFAELGQMLNDGEGITVEVLISQYKSQNRQNGPGFPTSPVRNPELREKRVLEQIRNAPHKIYEERIRNERVTKFEINQRETLQQWYTNHDSDAKEMVCQICKEEMPFKKTDGEYYFLAIEALTIRIKEDELPEKHFPKEYGAQYLALCPECAARYDYFVRTVKEGEEVMDELRNHIINSEDMEFPLKLGELETSIRFVEAHFHDLKKVLRYYENQDEVGDSTDEP